MKNIKSKKGFTIVEVMVASILTVIALGFTANYYIELGRTQKFQTQKAVKEILVTQWDRMLLNYFSSLAQAFSDPERSFYIDSAGVLKDVPKATCPVPAGSPVGTLPLPGFCWPSMPLPMKFDFKVMDASGGVVDRSIGVSSHDYLLWAASDDTAAQAAAAAAAGTTAPSTGSMSVQYERIMMSRCVDATNPLLPKTFDEIDVLPRPVFVGGKLQCCPPSSTGGLGVAFNTASCAVPGAALLSTRDWWPTIFFVNPVKVNPDGTQSPSSVSSMPGLNDRFVVPGMGFMITYNSGTSPSSFVVHSYRLVHGCLLKRATFLNCPTVSLGMSLASLSADPWQLETKDFSGEVMSGFQGSSYMRFGTRGGR